jgi:hypothetical protein
MSNAISGLRYQSVTIAPNVDGIKPIDLTDSILEMNYYEDILSPCITMTIDIINANSIFNGIQIRGGERVAIEVETASGPFVLNGEKVLYVNKVSDLNAEGTNEKFTLHLVSREALSNETSRCMKKYQKQTIDNHIKDILKNTLITNKIGIIEPTSNSYTFIGNNKKPFHTLIWLGPKSVSQSTKVSNTSGNGQSGQAKGTAGFLFYENYDGFNFRSIDNLVANTQLGTGNKKAKYTYHQPQKVIEHNNSKNNFNMLNYNYEKNIDTLKALRVGMYKNITYFYDTYGQSVHTYTYTLKEEMKKSTKLGGQENIPIPKGFEESISRIVSRTSDHGILSNTLQIEDSGRDNADVAKSYSRYNLLFSQAVNINIPMNLNLKAGDIIEAIFPRIEEATSGEADPEQSGNYLIKELCHHFDPRGGHMLTSAKLIRDSYGLYGPNQ